MTDRILLTLALVGIAGYTFAQADRAPEVSCASFVEMTPEEQALALADAVAAGENQAGAPDLAENANETVVAACTANPDLTLGAAIGQATVN